ncbi:MAG: hypothetical protein JWL61_3941 [Gemmatimonadetes bacterium]|nr:hypothetical protein [Gemmatimonadota bacterium]
MWARYLPMKLISMVSATLMNRHPNEFNDDEDQHATVGDGRGSRVGDGLLAVERCALDFGKQREW